MRSPTEQGPRGLSMLHCISALDPGDSTAGTVFTLYTVQLNVWNALNLHLIGLPGLSDSDVTHLMGIIISQGCIACMCRYISA